jgi:uncharacterized membrane protein
MERSRITGLLLWALTALYAAARLLHLVQDRIPLLVVFALPILAPLAFALVHGRLFYGSRGVLVFVGLCVVFGNAIENVGILTGLPFGRYYFTDVMGPKLLNVPILLGLAYVGMGYLSWTLGRVILGDARKPLRGFRVVVVPLVAGLIMVAWDLSLDPIWSTVVHGWIWTNGGAYFGVPVINFPGWYFTVYVIYQSFALYLRDRPVEAGAVPSEYWRIPVILYGLAAVGNLLLAVPLSGMMWVTDPAGKPWNVSHIFIACAGVSIVVMGGFAVLAWSRLADH